EDADPAAATSEDPQGIVYDSSGTKLVTFTISDANCSEVKTETITISTTPSADFTTTAPTCTEETVTFTNTGTTGDSYAWNFGDGNTSASQNPTNAYTTAGNKVVKLVTTITTIITCKDSSVQAITINQKPNSTFSFTGGTLCGNVGVDFDYIGGTTGDTWSYSWDFGKSANPPSSTSEDPQGVLYDSSGTHTVTFTISDANCSESSTQSITISPTPTASFTSTTPACTEDSVDFTNTGTTGANWAYNWTTFGSGASSASSTSQNPTDIIYSTEGIKSVTLVIVDTGGNCSDTSTQTININFRPNVSFITSSIPVCAGAPINFTNSGTSGDSWSYNWDFGKDAITNSSTAESPKGIKYANGGSKTITFTISDNNCTKTFIDSTTVTIDTLPNANAGIDTIICANRSVPIGSGSIPSYSYSWYPTKTLDNSAISNPIASPEANITVYYVLVTDTATSCMNTDSVTVTMLSPLLADAGEDIEICFGDSVQIGSALIEGQTYSWSPILGLNVSTSPNPMVSPETTTTYTVTVNGAKCDVINDEVVIVVHPLPDADAGSDVTIARGSSTQLIATGGVMYGWSPGDGLNNISIFDPVATPDSTTSYIVMVTDVYDCVNTDTVIITVVAPTVWTPSAFTPNGDGQNDVFYARGEKSGIINFKFRIFNKWGDVVFYSEDIDIGWDGYKIVTREELPEGAYIYNVQGEKSTGESVNISGVVNLIR
ncbi:MAG: gliding motility-associated C-terminal domain-containing protein, partial [Bacteroidia bacterium]|nr:gliding motility-associated C-terminal domain-containing protein [Bacteroidia bacterium]